MTTKQAGVRDQMNVPTQKVGQKIQRVVDAVLSIVRWNPDSGAENQWTNVHPTDDLRPRQHCILATVPANRPRGWKTHHDHSPVVYNTLNMVVSHSNRRVQEETDVHLNLMA